MSHISKLVHLTPKFVHGMVVGAFIGIVVVVGLRAGSNAQALNLSSGRDCDSNAVINCGALTTSELKQRYSQAGVAQIFAAFGITSQDISNISSTAVAGQVLKDGRVQVNGKNVATNAVTVGRLNIAGSTRKTYGGVVFYERTPSVSFQSNSIAAFVVFDSNGQFKFAILASCGNSVRATPVPQPKPTPTPTPKPTPTPTPTPTPPAVTTVSTPPTTSLPNTGPGAIIIITALAIAGGTLFHMTHRHVRAKRHARRYAHHGARH